MGDNSACGFLWCRMVFIRLFKKIDCSLTNKPPSSTSSTSIIVTKLSVSLDIFAIIFQQVYFISSVFVCIPIFILYFRK